MINKDFHIQDNTIYFKWDENFSVLKCCSKYKAYYTYTTPTYAREEAVR